MKKRFLLLLMAVAMLTSMLPVVPAFAQDVWNGTDKIEPLQVDNVYQIGSGAELAWFANYVNTLGAADTGLVNVDAVLTDDINLGGNPWTPIGLVTYIVDAYAGTFDGQNHTVSGLKINASTANYGLFSLVNTGTVKNLKVDGDVTSNNVVGGIVGKLQTGTIENCSMSGSVSTTGASTKGYAGGIIGTISSNNAVIIGCCNTADISGTYAGGIIGYTSSTANINSCYNTGNITGTTRSAGIAGQQSKGSISYCYNIGSSTNGIYGFSNASITNCYYLNDELSTPGGTASGYEKITDKASLLDFLNENPQRPFSEDTAEMNNGYPVLKWQLSSGVSCVPVTKVNILGNAVTGTLLTAQALGENDDAATSVQYQWLISDDKNDFTNIAGKIGSTFEIPDTADYAGKYIKVIVLGEENSAASAIIGPIEKSDTLISKEASEKVQNALDLLTLDITVIKEAIKLNLVSQIGECSVEWVSNNPQIITDEGVVTLPDKNIVSVMLTANVTCGGITESKQFTIDVWAADVDADVYLQKVLDSMEWNFKLLQPVFGEDTNILIKFKDILSNKGFDGVTVTVKSTEDKSLISQNGKIAYPSVPDCGSFANGMQVKVFFNLTVGDSTVVYPTSNIYSLLVPWDTSDIEAALEASADNALTGDVLRADNSSLSSVLSDLNLPSCIDGDKYSFAWVTWQSSDNAHLKISNENRQNGADSLYNSFVGKVYQDKETHFVTLTATITNPSTNITITKTFEVTINPLSETQIEQSISSMNSILNCYTADKLIDFVTKQKLDVAAVDNDIQLVIPKNVVTAEELKNLNYGEYWDYWNYKFTVSSSDTNIIEINSFRAYVYRPLGEDSSFDKQVTLTVKMESKANSNLFVTKNIAVTVKHLSRAEINDALNLMDRAKTDYSTGLLGKNTDAYSVIDNLTPYKEIIWNADKSGVDFIYRNSEIKNSGIVVDELPGWEEQEDWRLFRTSNKNLITNETLILNETPADDMFVKINSVLTDEIFGKYYVKFQNSQNYDSEALAKFKQLYKQPVSAYVMAVGNGNYTQNFAVMAAEDKAVLYRASLSAFKQELDKPISVSFTLLGLNGISLIAKIQENSFTSGATVFDVFKKVLSDNNISYTARGSYITAVNGLSEFDHGKSSGWMYTVGNVFVNSYMNAQELYGGEDIVVMYVTDYSLANKPIMEVPSGGRTDGKTDNNTTENNTGKADSSDNKVNDSIIVSGGNTSNSNSNIATYSNPKSSDSSGEVNNADTPSAISIDPDDAATDKVAGETEGMYGNSVAENNSEKIKSILPTVLAIAAIILLAVIIIILKKRNDKKNEEA